MTDFRKFFSLLALKLVLQPQLNNLELINPIIIGVKPKLWTYFKVLYCISEFYFLNKGIGRQNRFHNIAINCVYNCFDCVSIEH